MIKHKSLPLSPHLTIYKPQITSVLSILHRITGVALFIGLIILLWGVIFYFYSNDKVTYYYYVVFNSAMGKLVVTLWLYCLFYHACAGIRYLFWSMGKGFSMKVVTISAYFILCLPVLLTIAVLLITKII